MSIADTGVAASRISRTVSITPACNPAPASIVFCLTRLVTSWRIFSVVCVPKSARISASSSSSRVSASIRLRLKTTPRLSVSAWRVFCNPAHKRPRNLPSAIIFLPPGDAVSYARVCCSSSRSCLAACCSAAFLLRPMPTHRYSWLSVNCT